MATTSTTVFEDNPKENRTFAFQSKLPKLPIPPLEDTCRRYLKALEALQSPREHNETRQAVDDFLRGEGPKIQEKLIKWAENKDSYIEEFWYESYLSHTDPVVLALNPYFVLEDDPTPQRGSQLPRAASLITSSLGFIHDLRKGLLQPDTVRGQPLDMDQYTRLFGTARIPSQRGCRMKVNEQSRHIVVLRRGQFYWFDVLDHLSRPLLTEREILHTLRAIAADADQTPPHLVARHAVGVLSTENRRTWDHLRNVLQRDRHNRECLEVVDDALFVVCLDDDGGKTDGLSLSELCANYLCGTYALSGGVQVGTCTNRWYDKLQIIVTAEGQAGINFEHTGVDGHTVLRFAADIFTDGLMLLARSINPSAPTLFHAPLSEFARSYKPPKPRPTANGNGNAHITSPLKPNSSSNVLQHFKPPHPPFDTSAKKLDWNLGPELRAGIRFAETRLSDLICQNDCQALEFKNYGKVFITEHGFSPDAFVQMAFQAAYFGLYGRTECTYEPAMTKAFLHGRTEAIRTVQPESVDFTKTYFSDSSTPSQKISALRRACERHVSLTRECAKGLGQDRHLYAIYCLLQRELAGERLDVGPDDAPPSPTAAQRRTLPSIFKDPGWTLLNTSIISTSNCGNPALRLFGFGPVAADGYGLGYIIKDDGLSICASSKHLQTRRFLDTLEGYLKDVQRMIIQLHKSANPKPAPFVDHAGVLRDARTGRPINGVGNLLLTEDDEPVEESDEEALTGYSFFDSGEIDEFNKDRAANKRSSKTFVGKVIPIAEY